MKFDSLAKYKSSAFTDNTWGSVILVFFFGFMTVMFIPAFNVNNWILPLICIVLLTICIAVATFVWVRSIKLRNEKALKDFAVINSLSYQPINKEVKNSGTLFGVGRSKNKKHILSGTLNEMPFSSYEYYYTTGAGRSKQVHDAMVFEVTLPRMLPHFVIDSQLEDVVPINFDKSQKIELEGDFHKYFDLYAPDTYGVTALTLLAPDAMEVLMEHAALCDMEVIDDKLYFYWPLPARNRKEYEQLFTTAESVLRKLGNKLSKANIFASTEQAQIHASAKTQGVRLKKSKLGVIFTVIGVGVYLVAYAIQDSSSLIFAALWFGIIGFAIFGAFRKARLKKEYFKRYKN